MGARPGGAGAAGASPRRPDPQRPDPHREAQRALGHGRVAVLDEGGGLVLVLRGRRPLRLGCRRLARCKEGRPLGGAGAGPPGRPGPHGQLREGHRPGPRSAARLGLAVQGKAVPGRDQMARRPLHARLQWANRSATASRSASSGRRSDRS